MTLWSNKNQTRTQDVANQRIGFGTLGGDHTVPHGLNSDSMNAVIDNADPRITYGVYSGSSATFTASRGGSWDYDGSTQWFQTIGGAAQFYFDGTSIAVMARTNVNSGSFQVYIDDVLASGRILSYSKLDRTTYAVGGLPIDSTSIVLDSVAFLNGSTSGEVMIGRERITFTGVTSLTLTGCTRGANSSVPAVHPWTEQVYRMSSTASCLLDPADGANFSNGQIVYYNPFLTPGRHKIIIVAITNTLSLQQGFWFDGFVIGTLLGARHINRQIGTIMLSGTTNASGVKNFGGDISAQTGTATIALLGWNFSFGSGAWPTLECYGNGGTETFLPDGSSVWDSTTYPAYVLKGSASTFYGVQLVFSYIGESI